MERRLGPQFLSSTHLHAACVGEERAGCRFLRVGAPTFERRGGCSLEILRYGVIVESWFSKRSTGPCIKRGRDVDVLVGTLPVI